MGAPGPGRRCTGERTTGAAVEGGRRLDIGNSDRERRLARANCRRLSGLRQPQWAVAHQCRRVRTSLAWALRVNYALRVAPARVSMLIHDLQAEMGAGSGSRRRPGLSSRVFRSKFSSAPSRRTAALNALTLIVSAIALLASLLTLGDARPAQLAPVWAMGVTRARLAGLEMARIVVFAAATAVFALPLGLYMAWRRRGRQCRGFWLAAAVSYVSRAMGTGFRHRGADGLRRGARADAATGARRPGGAAKGFRQ